MLPHGVLCAPSDKPALRGTAGLCDGCGFAAPVMSSSLEPSETNSQILEVDGVTQRRHHWKWLRQRGAIVSALAEHEPGPYPKRTNRLSRCCRRSEVRVRSGSELLVIPLRCRDRLCPRCSEIRSGEQGDRAEVVVGAMDAPRFITLTAPSWAGDLREQLALLRKAFTRLRRDRRWREHVWGGVYTVQVTRSGKTGLWHPHLHCVVDGVYWEQRSICAAWSDALAYCGWPVDRRAGSGVVVDIRAAHGRRSIARYIARYVASPAEVADWPSASIWEYAEATRGQRMLVTFGTSHGVRCSDVGETGSGDFGEFVCDVEDLLRMGRDGDGLLKACVRTLARAARGVGRLLAGCIDIEAETCEESEGVGLDLALAKVRTAYSFGSLSAESDTRCGGGVGAVRYLESMLWDSHVAIPDTA